MFIGNLVADLIGGLIIGVYSENFKQVVLFVLGWSFISLVSLLVFERDDFRKFKALRIIEETKLKFISNVPHKLDLIVVRLFLSYVTAVVVALLVVAIKKLFG